MPAIDLSILNQRQTPAFYADILANRPSAGFVGRIFVSTDTFAFYRDNGTTWDLIGGPGTGTVTGTGANGQVTYWNGASTITGSNDLFWDNVNGHLGIGTNVPGTALQIDHDQNQFIRLNQTTATNDTKIAFQNSGVALWRIGNSYNAGANDFGIYDVVGAIQPVTVKKTTGQVLIGTSTVGSGKLVVASSTGDNGVQIVGAAAPSLRIDNAESGPTKRAGLGISTAANNFIQGSADRDFCMFNGSTTASPILFGIYDTTNVQEAARISAARNFIVGSNVDAGYKFDVNGSARVTGAFYADNTIRVGVGIIGTSSNNLLLSSNTTGGEISFWNNQLTNRLMTLTGAGSLGIGIDTPGSKLDVTNIDNTAYSSINTLISGQTMRISNTSTTSGVASTLLFVATGAGGGNGIGTISGVNTGTGSLALTFGTRNSGGDIVEKFRVNSIGNVLIGTTTDNGEKLQVNGNATIRNNIRLNANGTNTVGGVASIISNASNTYGGLAMVWGSDGVGNIFSDIIYYCLSNFNVLASQAVSGVPALRIYSVDVSGNLLLRMASGTYTTSYQALLTT